MKDEFRNFVNDNRQFCATIMQITTCSICLLVSDFFIQRLTGRPLSLLDLFWRIIGIGVGTSLLHLTYYALKDKRFWVAIVFLYLGLIGAIYGVMFKFGFNLHFSLNIVAGLIIGYVPSVAYMTTKHWKRKEVETQT